MHRQHGMKWLLDEDGMSKEYLQLFIWNNHDLDDLKYHLSEYNPKIIEWFSPYECDLEEYPEYNILSNYKSINPEASIKILSGESRSNYVSKEGFEIYHYPVTFFIETIDIFRDVINEADEHPIRYKICSFNNCGHYHRAMLIDRLFRDNILNNNLISWQNFRLDESYKFNWFEPKQVLVDNFQKSDFFNLKHPSYDNIFLEVVSETSIERFFITEKTVKPLLFGRPFIVQSKPGFNHMLKDLGFELYDEIIDYGFDLIENDVEYCDSLVQQVKKINEMSFEELKSLNRTLLPKIKRNQRRALDIVYDSKYQYIGLSEWKNYQPSDPNINIKNQNNRSMNWYWIAETFFK